LPSNAPVRPNLPPLEMILTEPCPLERGRRIRGCLANLPIFH
jgi:hypothetical protein